MPRPESMKRSLRRQRYNAQGNTKEPTNCNEVVLDEEMLKMVDGTSFLLADDGVEDRIIIFCGEKGKECLKGFKNFFMDGTFKSCSKQFTQIYSIHADFGSTDEETNINPVLFALLPNKKKETYIRMLRLIRAAVPGWNPETVNVDFEMAATSAIRDVFPSAHISGCFFHMKKCLWRKVQEVGLSTEYRENEEIRLHIRMCAALAFLKPEEVQDGWMEVHSQAPESPKLSLFFDYFIENWLENSEFPVEMWNCHQRRHRTTNSVEGWNNRLNTLLGRPNPRIKDVVMCLKAEGEKTNCTFMRYELSLEGTKRKKKYTRYDVRLERIMKRYEANRNLRSCLTALSYTQNLE